MNSATQNLARRLIALEANCETRPPEGTTEAARVCEKLRVPLAKFLGLAGYRSLMARALTMAKNKSASLESVEVRPDGSLVGMSAKDADGAFVVLAHLLGLLVEFVGERMTLRLVLAGWPNASLDESDWSVEEHHES